MRSGRLLICLHSGVFLRRQYLAFMGQTNRALVNRFVQRCGSAAVEQPWNGSRLWLCRIDAGAILEGRVAAGTYGQILRDRGFQAFLSTQFLGAFNDNVFKIAVSYLAMSAAAGSGGSGYLTAVGAVFILPFLLFSGYAGQLADRFSKRNVLVVTKSLEIVSMGLAVVAFGHGGIAGLLAVLFLMALQSTFFSPAKYGIVPELISDRGLSRANGLLEMTTFVAIILGTSVGAFLFDVWEDRLTLMGATLVGIAVVGTLVSFRIPRVAPAGAAGAFRLNPWGEIAAGIKRLRGDRTLWLTVIGISYFFFLGTLLQMVIILFGMEVLQLDERWIGILQAFLAVGIAIGSIAAGRLSGDKVELGLVPIGSVGMGVCSMWLAGTDTFAGASALLVALGLSGGLFIVPLNALLQQRAGATEKGQLIATNNFLNTGGILLASATLWLLRDWLRIPAHQVILIFGLFTLAANVYVLSILPDFLIRFVLWLLTHSVYRIRISGQEHVPFRGPALLVCNHLSLVDGFLVGACVQRFIRFMVYKPYYEHRAVHWLFRLMKAIPVASGRRDVITSLARARAELQEGHVVCVFAEGAVSRTGNLLPFKRGFERIVKGLDVPVIPVHLDQIWGSIFSFKDGRAIWKRPRQFFRRVTVTFGAPLLSSVSPTRVRQAIQEIGAEAVGYRIAAGNMLHRRFLKTARRCWFSFAMADSTGMELTFGKALARSLALSRWIRRCCRDERMVGIMMPSSVGGALANIATLLAGKVPINLNFTVGRDVMDSAIAQCEIRTVLTSRDFLSKAKLEAPDGACFLEDAMKDISALRRLGLLLAGLLLPARVLEWLFVDRSHDPDNLATVIFSSGSTGIPKGVMLSHRNILANVEGVTQVFSLTSRDRMMGTLPFFHSFGFTGCLWLPMVTGFGAVYHSNPLDAGVIAGLVKKYRTTLIMSTPTFYSGYIRKCDTADFAAIRYAIAGAEKLREPVARAFREKFGIDMLEGYGCTEMSPVVAVNVPDNVGKEQVGTKLGTVGHPIPGVAAKVVDVETGDDLDPGEEGLLLVRGANRMLGYLNAPGKTAEVFRGDWYVTGDIAKIDDDGFITLTDRLSRFSKIAGAMVPHLKIEETIQQFIGEASCVVTGVPDESKGERIVALHTNPDLSPSDLWTQLTASDLPKPWIPKRENLFRVEAIPVLGTGKIDLRGVRRLALEMATRSSDL